MITVSSMRHFFVSMRQIFLSMRQFSNSMRQKCSSMRIFKIPNIGSGICWYFLDIVPVL